MTGIRLSVTAVIGVLTHIRALQVYTNELHHLNFWLNL